MGCAGTKQTLPPKPFTPIPPPEPSPSPPPPPPPLPKREPSIEFSSDCINILIDDRKDEHKIDVKKTDYSSPTPPESSSDEIRPVNNWFDDKSFDNSSDEYLYQYETVSDYVLSDSVPGYKAPKPTKRRPKISFDVIDAHAKQTDDSVLDSFKNLLDYLTRPIQHDENRELLTARAIVLWMSQQNIDTRDYGSVNLTSPKGLLQNVKEKKMTYATCYTILCRESNLACVLVDGLVKAAGYEPGDTCVPKTSWTAVYVEGSWQIVHPFWICRALYGHNLGGWVKIEAAGTTLSERERASKGVKRNTFQEHYFMPKPKEFVYKCFATDTPWQLLPADEQIKTEESFTQMPYLLPPFFGLGLELISESKCVLESTNGACKIEIKARSSNANLLILTYELFAKEFNESSGTNTQQLSRIVFNSRSKEYFTFDIRFPSEGTFKLIIYGGPHKSPKLRLCEFKLICKKKMTAFKLLPPSCDDIGWGPGPDTAEAGLLMPSRPSGFIGVPSRIKKADITFQVRDDCIKTHTYTATMSCDGGEVDGNKYINTSLNVSAKMLTILVELPKEGEYGVSIHSQTTPGHGQAIQTNTVCNYLMSTVVQRAVKANVTIAKKKLSEALDCDERTNTDMLNKIHGIDECLKHCEKQKIPSSDEEISIAKNEMEFLSYKYLLSSCLARRQVNVAHDTLNMINRYQYKMLFQKEIRKVEELEATLAMEQTERRNSRRNSKLQE